MDSDLWISRLAAAKRQYSLHQQHQSHQSDRFGVDDFEVEEEEVRPDFPCPYCYEDHDIASLCTHLEDEHPFESKVTVCPICSVKVSRDMLSHITLQHGHLFKLQRRRRLRRVALPNSQALSLLGRDLREAHLQVLLGGSGYRSSNSNASNAVTDSLLSSLVLNFPASDVEEISKSAVAIAEDTSTKKTASTQTFKPSLQVFKCLKPSSNLKAGMNPLRMRFERLKASGLPYCNICPHIDATCGACACLGTHCLYSSLSHEERERKLKQATVRAKFMQDLLLSTFFSN